MRNKEDYVNNAPYCLHIWKKIDSEFEMPPSILVGFKNMTPEQFDINMKLALRNMSDVEKKVLYNSQGIRANRKMRRNGCEI